MRHVVEPGDTLSHLALRYRGDALAWPVLWEANRQLIERVQRRYTTKRFRPAGPDWIFPGTALEVPCG